MSIRAVLLLSVIASKSALAGTPLTIDIDEPSLDRWNYPFNATPGARTAFSSFGAVGSVMVFDPESGLTFSFDQRDAQVLIGFEIADELLEAVCPIEDLRIVEAVVTLTISLDDNFRYDSTYDAYTTYLGPDDPDATVDVDEGRPIELYGVGYRNGFDQSSFQENSPFGVAAWEARNVFPVDFDDLGIARDVSNNVNGSPTGIGPLDPFDPSPFALGQIDSVPAGSLVPVNSVVTFTLDTENADVQGYLREALQSGEVRLMVTSLQPAAFETQDGAFAAFYSKENIFSVGRRATLRLTLECVDPNEGCSADFDGDGDVDLTDFGTFGSAFNSQEGDASFDAAADFDEDGDVDLTDFGAFGAQFNRDDC